MRVVAMQCSFANLYLTRTDLNIDPLQVYCNFCNKWMHAFCVCLGEESAEDL